MHLVIPFILLMSSIVAAAPSVQHAQISVELTTMDARDQLDAPYSPEGLVINPADECDDPENLPFNFTLSVQYANWGRDEDQDENLSFGFKDLKSDTFVRGEIGFPTEFAFRKGFLINGNKALGLHPNRVSPGWTTLWPLKEDQPNENIFDLLVWPKQSGGKKKYFLEFTTSDHSFGAVALKPGEPIIWGDYDDVNSRDQIFLIVEPVGNLSDDINEDSAEEIL